MIATCPEHCAVAVSGGADSMALLHMLHTQASPQHRLVALTVDHGLRPESAQEAQNVAAYCTTLGIPHYLLHWTGPKPGTGLQNHARNARRRLLLDTCRELGLADLYLGHQADDQAETYLQRLARGSGPQGLSGMKARSIQEGITLHRPLLGMRRQALRAYCIRHAIPFHDDPSNDDRQYERIRWRQLVAEIEKTRPDFVSSVLRSQHRSVLAVQAVEHMARNWLAEHHSGDDDKHILPRARLERQPLAVITAILRQLTPSGKSHDQALDRLEEWVAQAFDGKAECIEKSLTVKGWWLQLNTDSLVIRQAPPRRH